MTAPFALGVSRCLLGEAVRYDGGQRRECFITDVLGASLTLVGVCPEVEAGFGVPREPMRLEGEVKAPRVITLQTRRDLTGPLTAWCQQQVEALAPQGLRGFILKSRSPSCGVAGVPLFFALGEDFAPVGQGVFVQALAQRFPWLPVIEEEGLHEPAWRENFIQRIFLYDRWLELLKPFPATPDLEEFHRRHKYLLMAHSPARWREMELLVHQSWDAEKVRAYGALLFSALARPAPPQRHVQAMEQILGCFKRELTSAEMEEVAEAIRGFQQGELPWLVPVTLLNHWQRRFYKPHLAGQWYLRPHPVEVRLRNHV